MSSRPWLSSYDAGVPTEIPREERTLVELLDAAVREFPERPALIFRNRVLTYGELTDHVSRLAGALRELGVEPGTRVAIQVPNLPQFVIGYYATMRLGAIPVLTNPLYTAREIAQQWNDAECTVAVVMDFLYADRIRAIRNTLTVERYVVASIPEYLGFPLDWLAPLKLRRATPRLIARIPRDPGVYRFAELVRRGAAGPAHPTIGMDDVATLLYTGGTTGVSKGAMLTHRNLTSNVRQLRAWFPHVEPGRERVLGALPFFHSYGLSVVLNFAISAGAAIVLEPNPRDIPSIVKSVERHRITLMPAVPAQFNAINNYPNITRRDLSSVKACNSGSAPLPEDVLHRFEELTGAKISEGYGLTETSPVTHSNPLFSQRKIGSIGVPLPSTDARIVDAETGTRALAPNDVGELIIRGPQVMRGYWRNPDATAAMIHDGWLYTGDLARMDEDGFFFIAGRKKDMILCSGYNVFPDEIDRVLMEHPGVLEAATIGLPDPRRGETVKSFVVLQPGATVSAEDLAAHCRENLAAYKVPRAFEFRTELPKSSVLKILRRELRAQALEQRET